MVTAGNGVLIFTGKSGRQYTLNFYSSDVNAAFCTFATNGAAGTGSQTFWNAPEDVVLTDVSFASSNTVALNWNFYYNDVSTGIIVPIANTLNTLAFRSIPHPGFKRGTKVTMIQTL